MTNERAIELLHRLQDEQFDGPHGDERREALSMAVRALEQNLVQESGGLVKDLVKDCISRQQAIEAFEPEHSTDWYTPRIIEVLEALPPVQPTQTNADSTHENTLDCVSRQQAIVQISKIIWDDAVAHDVKEVLKDLPSAQPQWIPCSERLPELYEDVLITDSDGVVDIASMDKYWDGDETKRRWYLSNYGFINVLAWMPLPKPYGGESE